MRPPLLVGYINESPFYGVLGEIGRVVGPESRRFIYQEAVRNPADYIKIYASPIMTARNYGDFATDGSIIKPRRYIRRGRRPVGA